MDCRTALLTGEEAEHISAASEKSYVDIVSHVKISKSLGDRRRGIHDGILGDVRSRHASPCCKMAEHETLTAA
jgi:hypothetical protein